MSVKPPLPKKNKQQFLDRLGRRTFFKADMWSAPDLGGSVRCLLSNNSRDFLQRPDIVFDLAAVGGTIRVVAMHNVCPRCRGAGIQDGAECMYTGARGEPCLDGLMTLGGLSFDPGEHQGSQVFVTPEKDLWATYMAR